MTQRATVLGNRYELTEVIGRGGMAEVWRARDNRLGREVAVKRLRVDLASDQTFQARFRREAQAAAGLNHPNIVSVYDTGEETDAASDVHVPYIVMELVEGVTLRDVLRDGRRILPERALEFTQGVLDALAYSHRAGIVHRDIKPANVMLTNSGSVKVMDFGIARAVADTSATMTQTAAVIGTAQYLSPEQARGEKVDNRSDIYSTGCLLYELLVSRPPFIGDSPVSVAYQHVRETPVAPSSIDPEITPAMDAIVLKSLSKDPAERYPDARTMRDDIARALDNLPVAAPTPRPAPAPLPPASVQTQVIPASETTAARRGIGTIEPPKKTSLSAIVLGSLMAALVFTIGIAIFILMRTPPPPQVVMVKVPTVLGFNEIGAQNALNNANLKPVIVRANNDRPKGEVVSQDPEGNTEVRAGTDVTITVSDGPLQKSVPAGIAGLTFDQAKQALEEAGFTGPITEKDADPRDEPINAKQGTVITSEPKPGVQAAPSDPVVLIIATGKSIVPNLLGKTPIEASQAGRLAGFAVIVETRETDKFPPGRVYSQSLPDGEAHSRTEGITVSVAKVPPAPPEPPNPPPTPEQPATPEPSPSPTNNEEG